MTPPPALEPIAEFSSYNELRAALNAARDRRDISFETLDAISGAPSGYFSKLLGQRPVRRLGLSSLEWAFGGLGIRGVIIDDPEALRKVQGRSKARDAAHLQAVLGDAVHIQLSRGFLRKIGAKGGKLSRANLGKRMKRKLARKVAKARWTKHRAKERLEALRSRKEVYPVHDY